ncbi:MAG: pseudouridine synthase, partial [Alphaproteobacteria bacterium]|nr:pseudouridine synthase [Alphaproteobacteria bacterium]
DRKRMAIVKPPAGKAAITHFKCLESYCMGNVTLVECELETGRTHQIRVHMTSIGHSLLGDPVYGKPSKRRLLALSDTAKNFLQDFNRQSLHAKTLGFVHPATGEKLQFSSDLPDDLQQLICILKAG